jgi:hypothetical protein
MDISCRTVHRQADTQTTAKGTWVRPDAGPCSAKQELRGGLNGESHSVILSLLIFDFKQSDYSKLVCAKVYSYDPSGRAPA